MYFFPSITLTTMHYLVKAMEAQNPTIFNIIRLVDGTIVSFTKRLMFQVLFLRRASCKARLLVITSVSDL